MKRHWRFLHYGLSSRLSQVLKCSSRKSTISSETVFSPLAEDRENKDSFTWLAGRDVPSESESLVELEVALELELGELDDEEYRLDFDLRFFEPFICFWAGLFAAFSSLRFFPPELPSSCQANFSSVAVSPDLFSRSYFFRS